MWGTAICPQQRTSNALVCPSYGHTASKQNACGSLLHPASASRSAQRGRRRLRGGTGWTCSREPPRLPGTTLPSLLPRPLVRNGPASGMSLRFCMARVLLQTQSDLAFCILLVAPGRETNGPRTRRLYSPARWHKAGWTSTAVCSRRPAQPRSPISQTTLCKAITARSSSDSKTGSQRGISGGGREKKSEMCTVTAGKTTSK